MPTPNVSVVDLVINVQKKGVTVEEINEAFRKAAAGPLKVSTREIHASVKGAFKRPSQGEHPGDLCISLRRLQIALSKCAQENNASSFKAPKKHSRYVKENYESSVM